LFKKFNFLAICNFFVPFLLRQMVSAFIKEFATGILAVARFSVIISALPQMNTKFADCGIHIKPSMKKLAIIKRHRDSLLFCLGFCNGSGQMPTRLKLNRFHPIAKFKSIQIEFCFKNQRRKKFDHYSILSMC